MAKKNNKKRNIIIGVCALLAVIAIAAVLFGRGKDNIVSVTTENVAKRTITQTVSAIGTIQPETEVKIAPETSGEISQLNVKEGDTVKAGQLLVRIKPDIVETQLEQVRYSTEAVKSNIPMNESNLAKAQADYNRAKELYGKKYISQQEFDVAKNALDAAKSSLENSKLSYKQAKASYNQTEKTAAKTYVHSPINGIVTQLNVEKGEKVVGTEMMAGTDMLVVSDLNVMNAEVEVDENDIVLVKIGDTATVEIDAFADQKFAGVVVEIGHSAIQSSTGTQDQVTNFKVKVRILDVNNRFRPGMSCNVEISTERHENVLAVPLQSVTENTSTVKNSEESGGGFGPGKPTVVDEKKEKLAVEEPISIIVYVVNGNKVKAKKVTTGLSDKGYIEITSGLSEGEEVVSGPYYAIKKELSDGAMVTKSKAGQNGKL